MSTGNKRPYAEALEDANAFRLLFPASCYLRWAFAGSLRRRKCECSDIEHVVIPTIAPIMELFSGTVEGSGGKNLLWCRVSELVQQGVLSKHVYGTHPNGAPMYRWGEKYRGVDFRGFNNELFTADADNWGAQLLIRTGTAEFSQRFVSHLKAGGMYRQGGDDARDTGYCVHVASGERVPVPDEETYFRLCGRAYVPPEKRA